MLAIDTCCINSLSSYSEFVLCIVCSQQVVQPSREGLWLLLAPSPQYLHPHGRPGGGHSPLPYPQVSDLYTILMTFYFFFPHFFFGGGGALIFVFIWGDCLYYVCFEANKSWALSHYKFLPEKKVWLFLTRVFFFFFGGGPIFAIWPRIHIGGGGGGVACQLNTCLQNVQSCLVSFFSRL